jgi:hypothetical protein
VLFAGGSYYQNQSYGLFYLYGYNTVSSAYVNIGSHILENGLT